MRTVFSKIFKAIGTVLEAWMWSENILFVLIMIAFVVFALFKAWK